LLVMLRLAPLLALASAVSTQQPVFTTLTGGDADASLDTCGCAFDLVMSCFVTEQRGSGPASEPGTELYSERHRYSRFDVLVFGLRTYAALPLERVYLYIELDDEYFSARRDELRTIATQLFGERLVVFEPRRLTTQDEWRQALAHRISPATGGAVGEQGDSRLVWLLQNDDHPFVDVNTDVLCEGLARMRADPSRFKSLYMSHWSMAINLAGRVNPPQRQGSYVVSTLTMLDSVQVFNFRYLHYLLSGLDWGGHRFTRIDQLIRQRQIYSTSAERADLFATNASLQTMYVPLRELCRKFDAYVDMAIEATVTRPLVLPPLANVEQGALHVDGSQLYAMVADHGTSRWSLDNPFVLPQAWRMHAAQLYEEAASAHEAVRSACGPAYDPLLQRFDEALGSSAAFPTSSRAACEARLPVSAGSRTCGAWAEAVRRSAPEHTLKQALLRVGSHFMDSCAACGPCGGSCGTPVALRRDVRLAATEPMEDPLVSFPNTTLVHLPWRDADLQQL